MPAYQAMMGKRIALTDAERKAANEAGTTMTLGGDAIHESLAPTGGRTAQEIADNRAKFAKASLPMITGKPWETREDAVEWMANQAGLQVMFAGQAPKAVRMLPGLMGPMAEARAGFAARQAAKRGLTLLDDDALAAIGKTLDLSAAGGQGHSRRRGRGPEGGVHRRRARAGRTVGRSQLRRVAVVRHDARLAPRPASARSPRCCPRTTRSR
jgi:hypothetical protein